MYFIIFSYCYCCYESPPYLKTYILLHAETPLKMLSNYVKKNRMTYISCDPKTI